MSEIAARQISVSQVHSTRRFVSGDTRTTAMASVVVLLLYILLAVIVQAGGNPFTSLYGQGDGFTAGLPSKIFSAGLSAWNPYVQLGQPTFPNTQFQPFYLPGLIIMWILPVTLGYNLFILLHYVLAGYFFYLFARNLGLSHYAAFLGGVCFQLSGFMTAHKGHQSMVTTAVWLPLMLYFIDRYARTFRIRELASCALALAVCVLGGFAQITLYSGIVLVAYGAFRLASTTEMPFRQKVLRFCGAMGFVLITAVLLSSLQLMAVAEALPQMTRERLTYAAFCEDYFPVYYLLAFIFPNMFGGLYGIPFYATNINFVELYPYMGLLPISIAIATFRIERRARKDVFFWGVLALAATVVSLGATTPLYRLLYFVPVYNLFRAPARHLYEIHFAISVLLAFGVERLLAKTFPLTEDTRRLARQAAWIMGGLFTVVFLATRVLRLAVAVLSGPKFQLFNDMRVNAILTFGDIKGAVIANLSTEHRTMILPTVFFALSLIFLTALAFARRAAWLKAALPLLIVADLFSVHHFVYHHPDTTALYTPAMREEVVWLKKHCDPAAYRVFPVEQSLTYVYPLLNMMYGLNVVNDYTPVWLKRFHSFTGFEPNGAAPFSTISNSRLMSLVSAKYLVAKSPLMRDQLKTAASPPAGVGVVSVASGIQGWQPAGAAATPAPGFVLQSQTGADISLIQFPVTLKPNVTYVVRFEARAPEALSHEVVVDLYGGAAYDNAAQDYTVSNFRPEFSVQSVQIGTGPAPPAQALLRIYTDSQQPIEVRGLEVGTATAPGEFSYREVLTTNDGISVFDNPNALPRFRFARELLPVRNMEEAHARVLHPSFDPRYQAVVEGISEIMSAAPGEILSQEIGDSRLEWLLRTGDRSFFIVGDSWYPGWKAYIDGTEHPVYVVDGFLRGVLIRGAGQHKLEMRFRPASLYYGGAGTAAGLILLIFVYGGENKRLRRLLSRLYPASGHAQPGPAAPRVSSEIG